MRPQDTKKPLSKQIGIQRRGKLNPLGIFASPLGVAATAIAVPTIAYAIGTINVAIPEINLKIHFRI